MPWRCGPLPILLLLAAGGLHGGEPSAAGETPIPSRPADPDRFSHLPTLLLDNTTKVMSSPGDWGPPEWHSFWAGSALIVGSALLLDHPVDDWVGRNQHSSWHRWAGNLEPLGGTGSVLIAGGSYLAGLASGNAEARAVGIDMGMTMAITQVGFVLPIKELVGRSRPDRRQGSGHFAPFQGNPSFPSGHSAQAFAMAAVISEHMDRTWVSWVSYSTASLVALSRIEQNKHFLSDVIAGGILGTYVGKTVVRHDQDLRARASVTTRLRISPVIIPGYQGVRVALNF